MIPGQFVVSSADDIFGSLHARRSCERLVAALILEVTSLPEDTARDVGEEAGQQLALLNHTLLGQLAVADVSNARSVAQVTTVRSAHRLPRDGNPDQPSVRSSYSEGQVVSRTALCRALECLKDSLAILFVHQESPESRTSPDTRPPNNLSIAGRPGLPRPAVRPARPSIQHRRCTRRRLETAPPRRRVPVRGISARPGRGTTPPPAVATRMPPRLRARRAIGFTSERHSANPQRDHPLVTLIMLLTNLRWVYPRQHEWSTWSTCRTPGTMASNSMPRKVNPPTNSTAGFEMSVEQTSASTKPSTRR